MAATSEKTSIPMLELVYDGQNYKLSKVWTITANNIQRLRAVWEKQQYEDNCHYTIKHLTVEGKPVFAFYFRVELVQKKRSHATLDDVWFCFHSLDVLERFILDAVSPFLPFCVEPQVDAETIKDLTYLAKTISPIHDALTVMHDIGLIQYQATQ
jgi:hypothetical protein